MTEQNRAGTAGELAVVFDRRDRFLAAGLYDPDSPIRMRVLHAGEPREIGAEWWRERLEAALARRPGLFGADTTGFRWIHGESDGWPGLVLDRYGEVLVLKLYSAAWLPRLEETAQLIRGRLAPAALVLRLSRNIRGPAAERGLADGTVLSGGDILAPVQFLESGIVFEADVVRGQKTGFFLDQRENRRAVEGLAAGRDVLNAFSFSGGFSLYAARGGARSVADLDISAHALESARRNFALNLADRKIARCQHEPIQADAFEWLGQSQRQFSLVVLDPPSLAKREPERAGALKAYARLAGLGIARLRRGGILAAASCSAHVSADEFFESVRQAARKSGRSSKELFVSRHPPDHPAGFSEAEYLKCICLEFI